MDTVPTYIIIGKSNSGKSFLAETVCGSFKPSKVVIINNRKKTDFGSRCLKGVPIVELGWRDVPLCESKVCYLLEDVVALKGEAKEKTYELLNVTSRYTQSPVIMITHSIVGTGVFGALSYATNIILTRDRVNKRALKVLLRHYYYDEPERVEAKFDRLKKRQYLCLRPSDMEALVIDAEMKQAKDESKEEAPPVEKDDLLAHFAPDAGPLVEFLMEIMPMGSIRKPDLSVHCMNKRGKVVRVSFIDYISCLRNQNASPDRDVRQFHRLMCRRVCFPSSLVSNIKLAKMTREEKKRQVESKNV